eukprot:jgi/Chrzof1/8026/UNPLg00915.t1
MFVIAFAMVCSIFAIGSGAMCAIYCEPSCVVSSTCLYSYETDYYRLTAFKLLMPITCNLISALHMTDPRS